jgi:hypothetical protein
MRWRITALTALILCICAAHAAPGQAATYKSCGSAGSVYSGALALTRVKAKNTTCRKARRFARAFTLKSGDETGYRCAEDFYCTWRGWQCRNDGRSGTLKHRCETVNTTTRRVMVVKWIDEPR